MEELRGTVEGKFKERWRYFRCKESVYARMGRIDTKGGEKGRKEGRRSEEGLQMAGRSGCEEGNEIRAGRGGIKACLRMKR